LATWSTSTRTCTFSPPIGAFLAEGRVAARLAVPQALLAESLRSVVLALPELNLSRFRQSTLRIEMASTSHYDQASLFD
jgi:hypothetical protein